MTEPLLEARGLKKYFPVLAGILRHKVAEVKAVDGLDMVIYPGEILGIVGESGCGKSTAGRLAIGLIEPTSGEIYAEGRNLLSISCSQLKEFRKNFQIIFQNPSASLNPRKTIGESLSQPLLFHGLASSKSEAFDKIEKNLVDVGLHPEALTRYPHQFSGGQQQRICIARALSLQPKLIVCDEALSALDVSVQAQILNLLIELKQKTGIAFMFISHDLSMVQYLADRVIVLYLGKVMETATVKELFENPKHPYTQALLSAIPSKHPGEKKQRIILSGEMPSPISPPSGCPFRTRCPYAQAICAQIPPKKLLGTHEYNCIL